MRPFAEPATAPLSTGAGTAGASRAGTRIATRGRVPRAGVTWGALIVAGGITAALLLDAPSAILSTLWLWAVVAVVRSDLDRFLIPDEASAGIAILGLVEGGALTWNQDGASIASALLDALANGAVAFGLFWLLSFAYRWRTGRDGLGFGDVKLAGACGIWLSFAQQAAALEIACLGAIGLVLATARSGDLRRTAVPFGAFLAPAAWAVFVIGPCVLAALERLS